MGWDGWDGDQKGPLIFFILRYNTRPSGALGVGLSLDPEGRLRVMGSIIHQKIEIALKLT